MCVAPVNGASGFLRVVIKPVQAPHSGIGLGNFIFFFQQVHLFQ